MWEAASWGGKSPSLLQQVFIEYLLGARHYSRPLMEHVFL